MGIDLIHVFKSLFGAGPGWYIRLMRRWFWNVLIAVDQLGNALLGGDPDETLSSRAAKNLHLPHWALLGRFLEWIDPGHLQKSLEKDEGKDAIWK